jgi:putative endopeptidase
MSRTKVFVAIVLPLALALGIADARVSGQAPDPLAAARGGVDVASMDKTADACTDFYQFACGGWMKAHPIPPDKPAYARFDELQDRNNAILRDILDEAAKPSSAAGMRKIGDYYASCMDEKTIDAKGLAPLDADLRRIAGVANKSDIPAVAGQLETVGETTFFSFGAGPDFKDASQYILTIGQGGMGLPDRDYYLKDDPNATKLRGEYEQHVARMLQLAGDSQEQAVTSAKAILQIETALAKAALDRTSQRNPTNIYHKMSRDEAMKLMPSFNLKSYSASADAAPGDSVNVMEPEFLKAADQAFQSAALPDLKAYMRWHVIHANATMLAKPFAEENFAFFGKTLQGSKEQEPRWKRCVRAVDSDLGEALGKAYVDRTFGAEGKERTLALVKAIEAALGQDIREITWMSDETKKQAEIKLRAVANKIGYPDRWRDYSTLQIARGDAIGNSLRSNAFEYHRQMAKIGKPVDKTEWLMTPPTVNAYYNPFENNINFPAGILQPPFFNKAADNALNFGAAAAVVGHELTHGFDDSGRRFDAEGNLRDWWTSADGKAFDERAACVANQYSNYTAVDDVKVNGKLTLGENVADNGGLRLAWMALMEDLKTKHLGEVDGFTPEQRFFIGWAQMWCENRSDELARLHVKINPHSPGKYRANGVVSNMPEFAKAFGCKAGAPMINQPICRVW